MARATGTQFALDFLPPYSPELNPFERVWKLTRRFCLHNRYFGFLEGVVSAVEEQFAMDQTQRYPCGDYAKLLKTPYLAIRITNLIVTAFIPSVG